MGGAVAGEKDFIGLLAVLDIDLWFNHRGFSEIGVIGKCGNGASKGLLCPQEREKLLD